MLSKSDPVAHKNHPNRFIGWVIEIKTSGMWDGGRISPKDPICKISNPKSGNTTQFKHSELVKFKGTIK
jgi:hypothetical protein